MKRNPNNPEKPTRKIVDRIHYINSFLKKFKDSLGGGRSTIKTTQQ